SGYRPARPIHLHRSHHAHRGREIELLPAWRDGGRQGDQRLPRGRIRMVTEVSRACLHASKRMACATTDVHTRRTNSDCRGDWVFASTCLSWNLAVPTDTPWVAAYSLTVRPSHKATANRDSAGERANSAPTNAGASTGTSPARENMTSTWLAPT